MDAASGRVHSISRIQVFGLFVHDLAHPVHRALGAFEGGPIAAVGAEDIGQLNGKAIISDPLRKAQRAGGVEAPAHQNDDDGLQDTGNGPDGECHASDPDVHSGGTVAGLHPLPAGTGLFRLSTHGFDEHEVVGPLRHGGGQLGVAAVDEVLHAELQAAQDKADEDVHRQRRQQGPHQRTVIAGDLPEDDEAGVGGGEDGEEYLHNQTADAGNVGGDTAEQLLGVVVFIEPQREAYRLAPDHPPQVPVHAGSAEVVDEARDRAQDQGEDLIEQIGQHHGGQTHVPGEEGGAVLGGTDAHVGDDSAGRQVANDPQIGQVRFTQHGEEAAEAAVIFSENCVCFH